jgi:hypothetical protein
MHLDNINGPSKTGTSVQIQVANQTTGAPLDSTVFEVQFAFRDDTNYQVSSFAFKLAGKDVADLTKKLNDLLK